MAVSFLFSYLDSRHEDALAEAMAKRLPDVPVTVSSAVAREFREYPRTATAALNAALRPVVGPTCAAAVADRRARRRRAAADHAVQRRVPARRPGRRRGAPAGALRPGGRRRRARWRWAPATACASWCRSTWAAPRSMCAWSATACRRSPPTRRSADDPILCPSVDIVTAGAGGGSIAWVDRAGRLRIGPQSAGASPGPAAFGRGGDRSTVTDAHVVAGTLPADAAAGRRPHAGRRRGAPRGGARPAAQLGLGAEDAADGIVQVAVAQMTAALRRVSVERGIDPREYTLVAFGGAGPLHAGLLLREAGLGRRAGAPLPRAVRRGRAGLRRPADRRVAHGAAGAGARAAARARVLVPAHARPRLTGQLRRDGVQAGRIRCWPRADCRFVGQGYELNIGVAPVTQRGLASLAARFRAQHLQTYGHADPAQQVEVVTLRLPRSARCRAPSRPPWPRGAAAGRRRQAQTGRVRARMPGEPAPRTVPLYDRDRLLAGNRLPGPAIVHQLDATTRGAGRPAGPDRLAAAACGWRRPGDARSAAGPARPDHVRAAQRGAARGRGGDGRGAEALQLQPDHPGDGRLQLRHLPARTATWSRRPTSSRPSSARCRWS